MKDIIALALKSGFVSRTYGDNSGEIAITCVSNLTPLNSELQRYSELLEAEIRKEFEVSIQFWKDDSAAAWDKCEERRQENVALTEQNTKLMEALEWIAASASGLVKSRAVSSLTPQPEKEGKE